MDELNKLYEAVSSKFDVGSFEDFSAKMGDTTSRKKFYDVVSQKGFDLGEYNAYEQRLSGQVPKKEKAEVSGELASPSANSGGSLSDTNPQSQSKEAEFSVPNTEYYNNIRKSLGKYKTVRDGSGRVSSYDPDKQTPTFNPVTGKVVIENNPSGAVRKKVLEEVKSKSGVPESVVSRLEKNNQLSYIKEVSDYLHLMEGEFEGKSVEEVISNMGIDYEANAKILKSNVDEAVKAMPYYEHEGKKLNDRRVADKDFSDIFSGDPELESPTGSETLKTVYGDIDKYGYNIEDFNMFLESNNPRLKALVDKNILTKDADIATQTEMFKNLRAYTLDRLKYINNYKDALEYRASNGEDISEELLKVDSEQENLTQGFAKYTKDNLSSFTTYMDRQNKKQADKYLKYKKGEVSLLNETLEGYSQGFFGGVQDLAIFIADGLGADDFAEGARLSKSIQDIGESEPLLDMWGTGKVVEHKGTSYMVTDEGQIIDLDTKKNITSIIDKLGVDKNTILKKAESGESGTFFSPFNTTIQGGNVMGNLTLQLVGTKGLGSVIGTASKSQVASTMVMTGGMVYTSTYEDVLQQLRDSGVSEWEAVEGASEIAMATATVAALSSAFAYNPKAQSLLSGNKMKDLVTKAVEAGKEGGKKSMFNSVKGSTISILYGSSKEGIEEVIQENLEYVTQRLVSANVNDRIGEDVLEEDIKTKDIINNSILAFAASSMLAGMGELKSQGYNTDKLQTIELLSSDYDKTKKNIDQFVSEGVVSQKDADALLNQVEKYVKYSNKLPEDVKREDKLQVIDLLDERGKLEQRRKNEDPAFHPFIKEEIDKVDVKIAETIGKVHPKAEVKKDNVSSSSTPKPTIEAKKVNKKIDNKEGLETTLSKGKWGMLTGENPNATQQTEEQNKEANKKAQEWLEAKGYETQPIQGNYGGNVENSFLVPDLTVEDAIEFAKEFNQESVATDKGLVYQDGTMHPRVEGDNVGGQYDDNYSTINTLEGDISFQTNYDWDNKIKYEPNKEDNKSQGGTTIEEGTREEGKNTSNTGDVQGSEGAISKKAKQTADSIRKLKINSSTKEAMSKLSSRPTAVFEVAWDGAIETVATTVAVTGHLAQAVHDGVEALRNSDWYRGLSKEGRAKAERMFREDINRQFGEEDVNNSSFKETVKASFSKLKEVTTQKFIDKFYILRKELEDSFDTSSDNNNFSQAEINMHGKTANDLDKFQDEMEGIIKEVADKGFTVDEFSDYLYAKHAEERNKHIKENIDPENEFGSGMTKREADKILNENFSQEQIEALEGLSAKIYKITQGTREMMRDFGLVTQEQYNSLTDYYQNYVPLVGYENEAIESSNKIEGTGVSVQGVVARRAGGRSTRADNVVANIISERVSVNMKARKNEVLQTLYNLASDNEFNGVMTLYTSKNLPTKMVVNQDGKRVKQPERPDQRKDYVGVKVDGEQYYIKFANAELGRVLNTANVEKADIITKTLRSVNRYLSATLTSLNPEFVISNFARDIQTAVFNVTAESDINKNLKGQNIAKNVVQDTGRAIKAIYANERQGKVDSEFQKYYDEFKEDGAKTGWANQASLPDIKKRMEKIHKMRTKKSVEGGLRNVLDFVNDVNTSVENGVRLSAYINARKAGMTRAQAASMAKELTVNFNKSGEYGTVANSLYLFFNAAIQGNVRFVKAMTTLKKTVQPDGVVKKSLNRGQKLALSMMAFSSMVTLLNQSISDDDEDGQSFYSKIPDFEKERNLIVMNPLNGKDYFKIPLPYGYNIFHNMGSIATEVSTGERGVGDAIGFLTSAAVGAFSPVSFGHSDNAAGVITSAAIPTIIKPLVELQANEDYFGSQIYNENLPFGVPKPDSDMGRTSTPEAFKYTSKFLNEVSGGNDFESGALDFAPESMYYLFKFAIGGTGKFLMNSAETVDTAVDIASGQDKDVEINKIPFARKVYAEPNDYVDQTNYFERFEMLQQRELAIKDRRQKGEASEKDRREYSKIAGLVKQYEKTNKELSEIRKKKKVVQEIEDPIRKTKQLRRLDDLYFKLIKRTNGLYNKRLGPNYE
jgi:hypothetical protein